MADRLLAPAAKSTIAVTSAVLVAAMLAAHGVVQAADPANAVYTMAIDGQSVRKLAQVEGYSDHAAPRWSHDGNYVVFDALPAGGETRKCFFIAADGSVLREIADGAMPAWSADDKRYAFQVSSGNGRETIVTQSVDGQARAEICAGMSPSWSPDGSRMAYGDGHMLHVIDLASGQQAALFEEPFFELLGGFDWSSDGRQIAMAVRTEPGAQRQLLLVSAQGAATRVSTRLRANLGGLVSFSPDGKQLVLAINNTIHIMSVDGGAAPRPVPGQRGKNRDPDWSPDGKMIVFVSNREVP